jgi:diaminohydroxyphosphoribosylaminopyrimidine deaminase/5-amino-6-(5-phosphoribosylamino)uracil reductase
MKDEQWMHEALELAKKGEGWTLPNPMVGAIVVKNGKRVGAGYHARAGARHAECVALEKAGARARGATLYTTLEPCAHYGKTPPCVDAIIRAGISRVVCATHDPHPQARGGARKLRAAGIKVAIGVCNKEAHVLNEAFFAYQKNKRPFVSIKFAASLDGKLATRTRNSKWITNDKARAFARYLRGTHQALVVGIETVLADDPHLGARTKGLPDPIRVILDSRLRIPLNAQVLRDKNVVIATTGRAPASKKRALEKRGIRVLTFRGTSVPPRQLLTELGKLNLVSVLVEGGGSVIGSFLDARVVDKVYACFAPLLIGGDTAISIGGKGVARVADALRLKEVSVRYFGDNILLSGPTK